jgi:hypothetical protein
MPGQSTNCGQRKKTNTCEAPGPLQAERSCAYGDGNLLRGVNRIEGKGKKQKKEFHFTNFASSTRQT